MLEVEIFLHTLPPEMAGATMPPYEVIVGTDFVLILQFCQYPTSTTIQRVEFNFCAQVQ